MRSLVEEDKRPVGEPAVCLIVEATAAASPIEPLSVELGVDGVAPIWPGWSSDHSATRRL